MRHRYRPRSALVAKAVMFLALASALPAAPAAQSPAYGIRVRAACVVAGTATTRVLADLSCENAMSCWSQPESMSLLDAASGEGVAAAAGELQYVDAGGNVQAEPPMQGTIRAIWATTVEQPPGSRRLQLAMDGAAATAPFELAADCAALPPAAVKRLSGS